MNPNRARFQAELSEAMSDWNQRTEKMAAKARSMQGPTGEHLNKQVMKLEAQRVRLVAVINALRDDDSDAAFEVHTDQLARAVESFERTFHQIAMSADALYEANVMDLVRGRAQKP